MKAQVERVPLILLICIRFTVKKPKSFRQIYREAGFQRIYIVIIILYRVSGIPRSPKRFLHVGKAVVRRHPELYRTIFLPVKQREEVFLAVVKGSAEKMFKPLFYAYINVFTVRKDAGNNFPVFFPQDL